MSHVQIITHVWVRHAMHTHECGMCNNNTHAHAYACAHAHTHAHAHAHSHAHAHAHIHTHTHTHTHTQHEPYCIYTYCRHTCTYVQLYTHA